MTKVDCYEKVIECLDENGKQRVLKGKKNATSMRMVIDMQAKHNCENGFVIFAVHTSSDKVKEVEDADVLRSYLALQKFQDVFLAEIHSCHLTGK